MFEPPALASSAPRVIAIDGDGHTRRVLHQRLAPSGCYLATAFDATTALDLCSKIQPDVIVLGTIEPPGTTRYLLGELQEGFPQTPVILIVRHDRPCPLPDELQRAVFATLGAPLDISPLEQSIARALESRGRAMPVARLGDQTSATNEPIAAAPEPVTNWQAFVASRIAAGSKELHAEGFAVMERQVMSRVLAHTAGNQARAARILGITRGHLRKKIRLLGIPLPGNRAARRASDPLTPGTP
jgi:DNA-binding NtrC family response regulator